MLEPLHRALSGQTLTPRELRIAGWIVLIWFVMDAIEWFDWAFHWRAEPQQQEECGDLSPADHAR